MARRTHIAKQEEQISERALQIRDSDPSSPIENQLWINLSSSSISVAKNGGIIRLNDVNHTETVVVSSVNLSTKTLTVSYPIQSPSKTKIFPDGGPPQIYSADFTVVSPNIITWGNMGLDGLVEEGDVFVIEYS